jgi:ankyrin repeat protein
MKSYVKIVKRLIDMGADIEARNRWGYSPLHCACKEGHVDIVKLLMERGADIEATTNYGDTPILVACNAGFTGTAYKKGYPNVVKVLLEKGANVNIKSKNNGYTPLHWACWYEHIEVTKLLLLWGADMNAKTNRGYSHLQDHVSQRLERYIETEVKEEDGCTPLNLAQHIGNWKVVRVILKWIKNQTNIIVFYQ